jgi:hypothetical protein
MLKRFAVGLGLFALQAWAFAACPENCNTKCCTSTFGLPSCELTCQATCAAANVACSAPASGPDLLTPKIPVTPIALPPTAPPAAVTPPAPVAPPQAVAPPPPVAPVAPPVAPPSPVAPPPAPATPARIAPSPVTPPAVTPAARVAPPAPVTPPPALTRPPSASRAPVDAAAKPGSQAYACAVDGTNQKVTITKHGSSCEAVYHKEGGRNETIWRSGYSPESCADKAREFFKRLGGKGLVCNGR